jgi:ubiquinone/menaquinone biosynthesis C-methylase UbiE
MKKVLFLCQPTQIYSDWIEKKLARNRVRFLSRMYRHFNFCEQAYYKANPRTVEYCLERAAEFASVSYKNAAEVHCIVRSPEVSGKQADCFTSVKALPEEKDFIKEFKRQLSAVDEVVLLYPDAIGQGYQHIESLLADMEQVYVVNGRRRVFQLTPKTRRDLKVRRILEKFFVMEALTSLLFPFFLIPYYTYERLTRRSYRKAKKGAMKRTEVRAVSPPGEGERIKKIASYWSSRPQTYGTEDGKAQYLANDGGVATVAIGDQEFFEKVDSTFYSWNTPLHVEENDKFIPFGKIFDYRSLTGEKVLEIGCGMGTMAMDWAKQGAVIYATDLSHVAVNQTKMRFKLFELKGNICLGDARRLPFEDNSFRYVYSWGVLHHSPNIKRSVEEIYRVLEPGGKVGLMLYNRNSLLFKYMVEYLEGFVHFEKRFLSPVGLASRYGDGAREEGNPYTYPVTRDEMIRKVMTMYENLQIRMFGTDIEWMLSFLCLPYHRRVPLFVKKSIARRLGWSMWVEAKKGS